MVCIDTTDQWYYYDQPMVLIQLTNGINMTTNDTNTTDDQWYYSGTSNNGHSQ